jgi:hypothetical protein
MESKNKTRVKTEGRRRKAQKLPPGETKSEILLYIAKNGSVETAVIREHLRTHLNIRTKKMTYDHLSGLVDERKLVEKKSNGKGNSDLYFLPANFISTQKIFNYLKKQGKEKEFIKTNHFRSYISSGEFRATALIYFIKEAFLAFVDYVKSDEFYEALIKKLKEKQLQLHEEGLNIIRDSKVSGARYTELADFSKVIALCNAKKPNKVQIISSILAIIENTDADTIFSRLISLNPETA